MKHKISIQKIMQVTTELGNTLHSLFSTSPHSRMTEKSTSPPLYPVISEHREGLTTEAHDWTMVQAKLLVEGQTVITM